MKEKILSEPQIISGGTFKDHRGSLRFVNEFKFEGVKRFYFIKHPNIDFVRAWQGHQFEAKYFYPIKGTFVVAWVKIDDFASPSKTLIPDYHIISEEISELIFIPPGYANGIKALKPESELMIFSDMEVEKSIEENKRYDSNLWFDWDKLEPLYNNSK